MKASIGRGVVALLLAAAVSGCAAQGDPDTSESHASSPIHALPTPTQTPSQAPPRFGIPSGFPVMAGAEPAPLPNDPTVIARWTVPDVGSAAYDFYTRALPERGFEIVGAYPAERAALIRFRDPSGAILQLLAELVGDQTQITLQRDRP
jgi:hypothetical protein